MCVRACPLSSMGGSKPCPSDAGGFTTASVMSWQRAEGGDWGCVRVDRGWRRGVTMAREEKVSAYYAFFLADKSK